MALESFPPLLLVGVRFVLSGGLLLIGARAAGARWPQRRELAVSAVTGVLILGVGNCCLTIAELWIPSGLAALIITVSPFWMVGIEAALPGGERLHGSTVLGMLVGLAGSALLVAPDVTHAAAGGKLWQGFLLLQLGCASWSFGSIYQRRHSGLVHPLMASALQQLAAGLAFLPPAWLLPHAGVRWATRGMLALIYLVVFGSIVGYSAYIYALRRLPVAVVSLYSYVNPVVAVILGRLVYREPFGLREAAAMAVIFLGVGLVKLSTARQPGSVFAEYPRAQSAAQSRRQRKENEPQQQRDEQLSRTA